MTRVFTLLTGAHVIVVSQCLRQANVAGKFHRYWEKVDKLGSEEAIRITNLPGFEGGCFMCRH